jgi:transcriptional regulator with XRE-family HTH domain
MSQLAALLKEYFERSSYQTVTDLTQAAQSYTSMSKSYVAHIMRGVRQNPAYDKLMAIARALNLDVQDTNRLLEAAGLPTIRPQDPQIQRVVGALQELAQTPGVSPAAMKTVVDGMVLMVDGARMSLGVTTPRPKSEEPVRPTVLQLPQPPSTSLTPEEGMIDDLLGEILSRGEEHPLDALFASLEAAARGEPWEVKRRIAEALPKLVQLQPEAALRLATILRQDYHPDYRADIRRRVVEAVPVLYKHQPAEALELLIYYDRDEVYMAMAAVEVLHDLENAGLIRTEVVDRYYKALRLEEQPAVDQEVIGFLRRLLHEVNTAPDLALASLNADRTHPERIFRIAIQRVTPRLLKARPDQALDLMLYYLRRADDGRPVEHQNLRRPVSKALPDVLELLVEAEAKHQEKIGELLQALADDPDIHVRRALGDALDRLVEVNAELGVTVLDTLIQDQDPYVRQRAWRVLLRLTDLYPEQAAEYYAQLLTRPGV